MTLDEWIEAVVAELGLDAVVDRGRVVDLTLDLARDVAHGIERRAAPVTTFLVGLAAGRAGDPQATAAAAAHAAAVTRLLHVDEQGVPEGTDGAVE